jgi:hypothetical protein
MGLLQAEALPNRNRETLLHKPDPDTGDLFRSLVKSRRYIYAAEIRGLQHFFLLRRDIRENKPVVISGGDRIGHYPVLLLRS